MDCFKKVLKVIAIVLAVAGVVAGAYFLIKKISDKKKAEADSEENYVSCSCCEA